MRSLIHATALAFAVSSVACASMPRPGQVAAPGPQTAVGGSPGDWAAVLALEPGAQVTLFAPVLRGDERPGWRPTRRGFQLEGALLSVDESELRVRTAPGVVRGFNRSTLSRIDVSLPPGRERDGVMLGVLIGGAIGAVFTAQFIRAGDFVSWFEMLPLLVGAGVGGVVDYFLRSGSEYTVYEAEGP